MTEHDMITRLTDRATKEALLARQQHVLAEQRDKVGHLTEQVKERISRLTSQAYEVDRIPDRFPAGAFGHDAETLDRLLAALADEAERLRDLEAADAATDRLTEKYQALIGDLVEQAPSDGAIPMPAGQYL